MFRMFRELSTLAAEASLRMPVKEAKVNYYGCDKDKATAAGIELYRETLKNILPFERDKRDIEVPANNDDSKDTATTITDLLTNDLKLSSEKAEKIVQLMPKLAKCYSMVFAGKAGKDDCIYDMDDLKALGFSDSEILLMFDVAMRMDKYDVPEERVESLMSQFCENVNIAEESVSNQPSGFVVPDSLIAKGPTILQNMANSHVTPVQPVTQ